MCNHSSGAFILIYNILCLVLSNSNLTSYPSFFSLLFFSLHFDPTQRANKKRRCLNSDQQAKLEVMKQVGFDEQFFGYDYKSIADENLKEAILNLKEWLVNNNIELNKGSVRIIINHHYIEQVANLTTTKKKALKKVVFDVFNDKKDELRERSGSTATTERTFDENLNDLFGDDDDWYPTTTRPTFAPLSPSFSDLLGSFDPPVDAVADPVVDDVVNAVINAVEPVAINVNVTSSSREELKTLLDKVFEMATTMETSSSAMTLLQQENQRLESKLIDESLMVLQEMESKNQAQKEIVTLSEEKETFQERIRVMTEDETILRNDLISISEAKKEIENTLQNEGDMLRERIRTMTEDEKILRDELATISEVKRELCEENITLKERIETMEQDDEEDKKRTKIKFQKTINVMNQEKESMKKERESWKQERNVWEEQKNVWNQQSVALEQEKNAWKQQSEAWEQQRDAFERQINLLQQEVKTKDAKYKSAKKKYNQLLRKQQEKENEVEVEVIDIEDDIPIEYD